MLFQGFLESYELHGPNLAFFKLRFSSKPGNTEETIYGKKIQIVVKNEEQITALKTLKKQSYVMVHCTKQDFKAKNYESWILEDMCVISSSKETPEGNLTRTSDNLEHSNLKFRSWEYHKKLVVRDLMYQSIRDFFKNKAINYQSPKLITTCSESGADLFEVTNSKLNKKLFLAQSPQLYKQMLINYGFNAVYDIAPVYRNQKFNTSRHLCETACLDFETVCTTYDDLLKILKALIIKVSEDLEPILKQPAFKESDFITITHDLALSTLNLPANTQLDRINEEKLVKLLKTKFLFVTNYPNNQRPFYTLNNSGFDLLTEKCELASGSLRNTNYDDLKESINKHNISTISLSEYLDSFKYGCPPSGGFGFGLDRFLMVLLDLPCVQDTLIFKPIA